MAKTRRQLGLFDDDVGIAAAPASRQQRVGPALGGPLANVVLPAHVRAGTSSWSFAGWSGLVYDAPYPSARLARDGLEAYAAHPLFRAVGLDRGFYRSIPTDAFEHLAAQVPDDFRFLVKAHRDCTSVFHTAPEDRRRRVKNERFLDATYAAECVVAPAATGLGEKLGVVLFQFPPQPWFDGAGAARLVERIAAFLDGLPRGVPYAVEVRNDGVLGPRYAETLANAGARHCFSLHPTLRSPSAQRRALGGIEIPGGRVVRWMLGHGQAYAAAKARYEPFDRLVDEDPEGRREIRELLEGPAGGLLIVNNKAKGSAPRSIAALARAMLDHAAGDAGARKDV